MSHDHPVYANSLVSLMTWAWVTLMPLDLRGPGMPPRIYHVSSLTGREQIPWAHRCWAELPHGVEQDAFLMSILVIFP